MRDRSRLVLASTIALGAFVLIPCARTRADRPPLCATGEFAAPDAALAIGNDASGALVLAAGRIALGATCAPVAAHIRRARGGTRVTARWSACGEDARGVRLQGIIDPGCTVLHGTLRVRRPPRRTSFVATCRAACGTPAFACLQAKGPLVTLAGTHTRRYEASTLPDGARLDARGALFVASPANRYPILLDGGRDACLAGATVRGEYDRDLGWAAMHDLNNAGVRFEAPGTTIDGLRVDDVTDGIRPVAGPFTIRQAWLSYVRDDCVENDHLHGGLIEDSLFDGCYVALSERPSPAILRSGADGRGDLLTIRGSLIRLQPMPGPRGGNAGALGHGQFFKWSDMATRLALFDNVFLAEQVGEGGVDTMGVPEALADCADNVMVWLGAGAYPAPLPRCFTVRTDRRIWDDAVAVWKARHPNAGAGLAPARP